MLLLNQNYHNFLLAEYFNFHPLMPFINNGKNNEWNIKFLKIGGNEVVFDNTNNNEELVIVISGCGGVTLNGESSIVKAGDLICIPKNTVRSIANINNEELLQVVSITIS